MSDEITTTQSTDANPFQKPGMGDNINAGTVEIESARAIAEVQAALLVARRFPRDPYKAMEKLLESCRRVEFAEEATYAYPRGGERVSGPSIRFAEEGARDWGNIEFGLRELGVYGDETEMQAYAWDLETNNRSVQTFRVKHARWTKDKGLVKLSGDPRDIYENNTNLGQRRVRGRLLAIMPPEFVAAGLKECALTLRRAADGGDSIPFTDRIQTLVQKFAKAGIKSDHLERRLGHKVADMLPDEYTDLVAIYKSLADKMSHPSDWFDVPKGTTTSEKADKLNEKLAGGENAPAGEDVAKA